MSVNFTLEINTYIVTQSLHTFFPFAKVYPPFIQSHYLKNEKYQDEHYKYSKHSCKHDTLQPLETV